jgi:hypothetical protein
MGLLKNEEHQTYLPVLDFFLNGFWCYLVLTLYIYIYIYIVHKGVNPATRSFKATLLFHPQLKPSFESPT